MISIRQLAPITEKWDWKGGIIMCNGSLLGNCYEDAPQNRC